MTKADARFYFRKDTKFGETPQQKKRRKFLLALEAWSDDRKDAVICGIDWLTDYYLAARGCEVWKARELATDHAAELVMGILFPAPSGGEG